MGEPAPRKKRSVEQAEMQHFVTDKAGKSNLTASATLYVLDQQVRDGSYPLHMALQAGTSRSVVKLILGGEEGEDLLLLTNKHGETPLHIARANPTNEDLVDLLTESYHSFEMMRMKEKQHGDLPVHVAATHGCSVAVAKTLLRIHPNSIHEKNKDSKAPLDLVLEQGHCSEQVVRLFDNSDHSETSLE
jgi:ankyrin repeat protein